MNLDLPREPKLYSTEEITMPFTKTAKLKVPSGRKQSYKVEEDGIYSSIETFDQDGEYMYAEEKMIISKDAFIEAYATRKAVQIAIDKQIPVKANRVEVQPYFRKHFADRYVCPVCHSELNERWNGCPFCLQAIDFGV